MRSGLALARSVSFAAGGAGSSGRGGRSGRWSRPPTGSLASPSQGESLGPWVDELEAVEESGTDEDEEEDEDSGASHRRPLNVADRTHRSTQGPSSSRSRRSFAMARSAGGSFNTRGRSTRNVSGNNLGTGMGMGIGGAGGAVSMMSASTAGSDSQIASVAPILRHSRSQLAMSYAERVQQIETSIPASGSILFSSSPSVTNRLAGNE